MTEFHCIFSSNKIKILKFNQSYIYNMYGNKYLLIYFTIKISSYIMNFENY